MVVRNVWEGMLLADQTEDKPKIFRNRVREAIINGVK
jgi:hypothetical protein